MNTDFKKVKADRARLIAALESAIRLVQRAPTKEVTGTERNDAIADLEGALKYMHNHPVSADTGVISFFSNCGLSGDQLVAVAFALKRCKAHQCHAFLSIPREVMEKEFDAGGKVAHIPYPTALRALHHAYVYGD